MRAVVRRAMEDGAFGVASALIYAPGSYASTAELVEEARAMAPYGGLYITPLRSEGDPLLEAGDEAPPLARDRPGPVALHPLDAPPPPHHPHPPLRAPSHHTT